MTLTPSHFRDIPLFASMTDEQLQQLCELFHPRELEPDEVLFREGEQGNMFYVLKEGEIDLYLRGELRFRLNPPAIIGELGALALLQRNTTARSAGTSTIYQVPRDDLMEFLSGNGEVAFHFYASLLKIAGNKIRRDQRRLEDMRTNLIATQKSMKKMRDLLLESEETSFSEDLHATLEKHIAQNRRVNYRVEPNPTLPATVRLDDGRLASVVEMLRTQLLLELPDDLGLKTNGSWSGVLCLPHGAEFPISGTIASVEGRRVELELDMLFDEYGATLDDYLTRLQMLDFLV